MLVKIKKINIPLPDQMDVWVDTSKVIAATEVMKFGDLPAAFKIFFDAEHSWDIAEESYQEFVDAWSFCNRDPRKPLYS